MDPEVRFGKPCIAGTRVDVATVVGAVAAGESLDKRVRMWHMAITAFLTSPPKGTLFELDASGEVAPLPE